MVLAQSIFSFFTDSILRAPTVGCMLMCLAAGVIGVIVFLRKESLLGEALSHAAYPGVILGVVVAGAFAIDENQEGLLTIVILIGAFVTAFIGILTIHFLEKKWRVSSDSALCFVLSSFFGIGLTLASEVQFSNTTLYKQALSYLYGQAATMTDIHIVIYGFFSLVVVSLVFFFYKELQVIVFDPLYAKTIGLPVHRIDMIFFILAIFAVIIGIQSVGVVLMSAMLIAPAIAARQFTNRLWVFFVLAGGFGVASGFLGNYLSFELTEEFALYFPSSRLVLPTGPMIVLSAAFFCVVGLFFAPERGLVTRLCRMAFFRYDCLCENILKTFWRISPDKCVGIIQIKKYQNISLFYLRFLLWRMSRNRWINREGSGLYSLTVDGRHRASKIVRFHRLWEVYLSYLGVGIERVHRNAEEIEHIMTPELESALTTLLKDPQKDPHEQPIPPKELFLKSDYLNNE